MTRQVFLLATASALALGCTTPAAAQSLPPLEELLKDAPYDVPSASVYIPSPDGSGVTFSDPALGAQYTPCFGTSGGPVPAVSACQNYLNANPPALSGEFTVLDADGRVLFKGYGVNGIRSASSYAYTINETRNIVTTRMGGGITAQLRIAGSSRVLASATADTLDAAAGAVLPLAAATALPGRRLPLVVTSSGVVESTAITGTSYDVTGVRSGLSIDVNVGYTAVTLGARGRCDATFTSCEGGVGAVVIAGTILDLTKYETVIDLTTTIQQTITSTGEVTVDIPFAAYGRVHPAAQAMGFEQGEWFLTRLMPGGDADAARPLGGEHSRLSMFLSGTGERSRFEARGAVAASSGSFTGLRGGFAWRASDALTLGLAGEGGRWRWSLDDAVLPERADSAPSWRAGGFLAYRQGPWRLALAGFGGRQVVKSWASSTLGGGTSTARYSASTYGAGAEAGYAIPAGAFTLTPSLGADWLGWHSPALSESGGLAPLSVAAASRDQWRLHAGLAADHRGERWLVGAHVTGTVVTGKRTGLVTASDGASQTGSFTVDGPSANRAEAEMGGSLGYVLAPGVIAAVSGDARIGAQAFSYGGEASLRVTF